MEYKIYSFNNYRIHTIKTDKFKNCSMEVMFTKKLQKEEITINNVLTDILVASTKNYKSRRDIELMTPLSVPTLNDQKVRKANMLNPLTMSVFFKYFL